jgi:hypothetical protein
MTTKYAYVIIITTHLGTKNVGDFVFTKRETAQARVNDYLDSFSKSPYPEVRAMTCEILPLELTN